MPDEAPPADAPDRKFVSRIKASSDVAGLNTSVNPQFRHRSLRAASVALRKR
jgi:hypothetical protein